MECPPAPDYCFCTLAIGKRYRRHAMMLAEDLQKYAPHARFIVLTDQPKVFQLPNTKAFKHRLQSVGGYHDKRFAIAKALSYAQSCIFLDSDVRILGNVPTHMDFAPGITVRISSEILEPNRPQKLLHAAQESGKELSLELQSVRCFHEAVFVVTCQNGLEKEFLELWGQLADEFELQGLYRNEGCVAAIAAAKVGLSFQTEYYDRFPFFKDVIERERLKSNPCAMQEKQIYFDLHKQIESPARSLPQKALNKLSKKLVHLYRVVKLQARSRFFTAHYTTMRD
jgi:hypothetical protein